MFDISYDHCTMIFIHCAYRLHPQLVLMSISLTCTLPSSCGVQYVSAECRIQVSAFGILKFEHCMMILPVHFILLWSYNWWIIPPCDNSSEGCSSRVLYYEYYFFFSYIEPINSNVSCSDGDVRLADGLLENQGRVEICYQNQWGTVCHDFWGDTDARIVCRQLGYSPLGLWSHLVIYCIHDVII